MLAESDLIWWFLLTIIGRNYKIVGFGYKNVQREGNEKTEDLDALGLPCSPTWSSVNSIVLLFIRRWYSEMSESFEIDHV